MGPAIVDERFEVKGGDGGSLNMTIVHDSKDFKWKVAGFVCW
jgi:hypothetical protein